MGDKKLSDFKRPENKIKFEDIFEESFVKKIYDLCEKVNQIENAVKILTYKNFADTLVDFLKVDDGEKVISKNDISEEKRKSFQEKLQELAKERNIKV
jgi:hypothetical protein